MLELEPPKNVGFSALPSPPAGLAAIPDEPEISSADPGATFVPFSARKKKPNTFIVEFVEEHPRKGVRVE